MNAQSFKHYDNNSLSVTAIKMNEILRELYLADNKLMPSDGIQLGNMLKFNHKLALLDLRNNHLQVLLHLHTKHQNNEIINELT